MNKAEDIIQLIGDVTTLFYQNKINEGYQRLETLINIIDITMAELHSEDIVKIEKRNITTILADAMKAMEQQDALLLADILEYELKEVFQGLL